MNSHNELDFLLEFANSILLFVFENIVYKNLMFIVSYFCVMKKTLSSEKRGS